MTTCATALILLAIATPRALDPAPPDRPVAPQGRYTARAVTAPSSSTAERDMVLFAAQSVQLRPPAGWQVRETAYGREIRLVVSPGQPRGNRNMPHDGIWLTCHLRHTRNRDSDADASERMLEQRLRLAVGQQAVLHPPRRLSLGGWTALRQDFATTASVRLDPSRSRRGFHILVGTDWGVYELHASAPETSYAAREAEFQQLLDEMIIHHPVVRRQPAIAAQARDAAPIFGSWKAYRSRLRIRADGRIAIIMDQRRPVPFGQNDAANHPPQRLSGRYQAQDDLLMVRWDDGSRLNFRWRLKDEELLLTDHEGHISLLRPLLE